MEVNYNACISKAVEASNKEEIGVENLHDQNTENEEENLDDDDDFSV